MANSACRAQATYKTRLRLNGSATDSSAQSVMSLYDLISPVYMMGLAHAREKQLESIVVSVDCGLPSSYCMDAKRDGTTKGVKRVWRDLSLGVCAGML